MRGLVFWELVFPFESGGEACLWVFRWDRASPENFLERL